MKAGRLLDEVDFLLPRLQEANEVPSEQVERMQMDETFVDRKDEQKNPSVSQGADEDML